MSTVTRHTDQCHARPTGPTILLMVNDVNVATKEKTFAMLINNQKTIHDLQEEFHRQFPGLKIEFYAEGHRIHEGSTAAQTIDATQYLGAIRTPDTEGNIELQPEWSVAAFESLLRDRFGLHVQVFRKSRNLWLQTSSTDDWTLEKQNAKGLRSMLDHFGED